MSVHGVAAVHTGDVLSTLGLALWVLSFAGLIPTIVGVFAALAAGLYYTAMFWDSNLVKAIRKRWFKSTPPE